MIGNVRKDTFLYLILTLALVGVVMASGCVSSGSEHMNTTGKPTVPDYDHYINNNIKVLAICGDRVICYVYWGNTNLHCLRDNDLIEKYCPGDS